ncbi:MAG TPA: ion transporter [Sphingomicrobium sp.]|nr:ion transporter [Sphingomicrobium sp.]
MANQAPRQSAPAALAAHGESQSHRWRVLFALEAWLRGPMAALSVVWLILIVLDLTGNGGPVLTAATTVIWVIFIAEFLLRLAIAPQKRRFLGRNLLTIAALAVPALRLFRAIAALRAVSLLRGARLISVVGTINRSMNALKRTLRRRAFGYVFALTAAVLLAGAAGMYSLEPASEVRGGFTSYWDALWWTGMLLTSIGSQYWPQTDEGRVLGFLLALYGLGILGYMTATIASFFIGRDAQSADGDLAGEKEIRALRKEIAGLREAITSRRADA